MAQGNNITDPDYMIAFYDFHDNYAQLDQLFTNHYIRFRQQNDCLQFVYQHNQLDKIALFLPGNIADDIIRYTGHLQYVSYYIYCANKQLLNNLQQLYRSQTIYKVFSEERLRIQLRLVYALFCLEKEEIHRHQDDDELGDLSLLSAIENYSAAREDLTTHMTVQMGQQPVEFL
ncbi:unnamed protein product [Didymodactylos carnosus]|uniref:Uncharacterized protein n=1 Tax=Didymodactylos carnosus TaxID=1234261 RepID=A0A814NIS3_9BILA|nr:unnamed protein product [Didymodactylos carnosus]CAF1092692.1 unnamed protein product [Didymodactylos carnosus]CAF3703208.1 unnamed protein product [Didymodactylos carnosus]CAF3858118.1 unnamed protein product [Didymodactylos carnosus]